jgi:hypothetical protein
MKYGIGRWVQILETGLFPGKLIQQLNGQTQRLLGQQSLSGFISFTFSLNMYRFLHRSIHLECAASPPCTWETDRGLI